jgi:predicted nucleotidyltransferase
MGRSRRAILPPIFRSEAQGRVLAAVFLAPEGRPPHVRLIANTTGLPYSTVQREVAALEAAGVVHSTTFATAKVVRPDQSSPYFGELKSLVLKTYGPAAALARALEGEAGVVEAYIFGSWAARYHGEPGDDPEDIDVLVVVNDDASVDTDAVEERLVVAGEPLGRAVNIVFTYASDWSGVTSPFLKTVRSRPLIDLGVTNGD